MNSRRRCVLAATIVISLASGCAKPALLYRWGEYENLVYDMYAKPGEADPATQTAKLSADIARTEAEGQRVPPGVHAHLGYIYYSRGNVEQAYQEFAIEKELFPESTVFVDGILEKMKK